QMDRVVTRLLSDGALGRRVVRLDNLKQADFGWADLERVLTSPTLNGHRMFKGDGARPNTLVWALTANGASLSRDLAQRCIIIQLNRPEYEAAWKAGTLQLVREHRWEIL